MKYIVLTVVLIWYTSITGQQLHTHNNAASVENEANSTNGWSGPGNATADGTEAFDGQFSIKAETVSGNSRDIRYNFTAVIGEEYNIVIWAKEGANSTNPAFANWQGVSGFSTTGINGQNWAQYTFTVVATSTSPQIRAYSNPSRNWNVGDHIFMDAISITSTSPSDSEAPQPVDDLASGSTTENSTNLNWTEPNDNEGVENYEVFQDGGSLGLTGGATSLEVTGLDPGTNYSFTVIAIDGAGNRSAAGNSENVTTLDDTDPPSAITQLNSQNTTPTSTQLFWPASSDNVSVEDYEVFQDGQSIGFTNGSTTINVTNLEPNSSYSFTVFGRDGIPNISSVSNTVIVNTPPAPDNENPSDPTNLLANNTGSSSTELSWTASTDNDGVDDYQILQDGQIIGLSGGSLSFQVNSLVSCTSYNFAVIAIDNSGNISGSSNSAQVSTITAYEIPPGTPVAPGIDNLSDSDLGMTTVTLNWSYTAEANDRILDFEVFQNDSSIGFTSGASTFRVTELSANTVYSFRVEPVLCSARSTGGSQAINITTLDVPIVENYDAENANLDTVDWTGRDLFASRNIGIGTTDTQGFRLAVSGNIVAEEIKVALESDWPDYVFKVDYELPNLMEVEKFIQKNGHLIDIPSEAEVKASGILIGEMNAKLLKKIEELTLYTIEQDKKLKKLEDDYIKIQALLMKLTQDNNEY